MFTKAAALVLTIGALACMLLTMRQQRLQAVHDLAQAQIRVAEHDRTLCILREQIARRLSPDRVSDLAEYLGPLTPMTRTEADPPGGDSSPTVSPAIRTFSLKPSPGPEPPARRQPGVQTVNHKPKAPQSGSGSQIN